MKLHALGLLSLAAPALSAVILSDETQKHVIGSSPSGDGFNCDLPPPVAPDSDGLPSADALFSGWQALGRQVKRHSAIVSVPTVSYDDMDDVDKDPRWAVFLDFHRLLEKLFPTVHDRMSVAKVNRLGLVYTIEGSDASLKPLMLTAHQDVVPVPDPSAWTYPPFSGHYDGSRLWGRGAVDCKNSLTALLSVMETLLQNATWAPRRSIVLAFGFDEESSGRRGAGTIAPYLEERFGRDSMVLILDEGGSGLQLVGGDTLYALPSVMEKGHVDVLYELNVVGGHSSTPLPHTGIGIAAEIITTLESNPYTPKMTLGSPLHHHYVCRARYTPDQDPSVTKLVQQGDLDSLAKLLASYDRSLNYQLQTSQAVDIISGGLKINAMPEKINIGVNYRVAPHNSIDEVKQRTVELLQPIVDKYKITLNAFGQESVAPNRGDDVHATYDVDYDASLIITTRQVTQVAPVSPTSGAAWDLFSGTIQHTFAFDGGKVVPVGDIMNGNTDTRHYLNLTPNIYRWVPMPAGTVRNIHAIDESVQMESHIGAIKFYYNLIRNFDASDA